jgi:hypothetical protein
VQFAAEEEKGIGTGADDVAESWDPKEVQLTKLTEISVKSVLRMRNPNLFMQSPPYKILIIVCYEKCHDFVK